LVSAIERYEAGTPPLPTDDAGRVEIWRWDDATKKLTSARYSAADAKVIWLSRLTLNLAQLRPNDRAAKRQSLLYGLQAAEFTASATNRPTQQLALSNLQMIDEVLAEALRMNYARAALAAIGALGAYGDAGLLYATDAQPSPLANALGDPNRRVRFAALRTIVALDPPSPYPGSSRVPEALSWFVGSRGERHALVAMPTLGAAANLAGMLAAHELDGQPTNRGRDAVDMARAMADLEMIFVDMDVQAPGIREVVYELRISPTTGAVPIALMAAEGRLDAAERLAAEHENVIAISRPHSQEVLGRAVEQLLNVAGRDTVPPQERASQATEARGWLEKLAASRPFYTIRRTATRPIAQP
jgi:hypothetical protein